MRGGVRITPAQCVLAPLHYEPNYAYPWVIKGVLLPVTAAEEVSALVQRNRERLAPWMNWVAEPFTAERARDWLRECIDEFVTGRRIGTYLHVDSVGAPALALYLSEGMRPTLVMDVWRKTLPT